MKPQNLATEDGGYTEVLLLVDESRNFVTPFPNDHWKLVRRDIREDIIRKILDRGYNYLGDDSEEHPGTERGDA